MSFVFPLFVFISLPLRQEHFLNLILNFILSFVVSNVLFMIFALNQFIHWVSQLCLDWPSVFTGNFRASKYHSCVSVINQIFFRLSPWVVGCLGWGDIFQDFFGFYLEHAASTQWRVGVYPSMPSSIKLMVCI